MARKLVLTLPAPRLRKAGATAEDIKAALDDLERALSSQALLVEGAEA